MSGEAPLDFYLLAVGELTRGTPDADLWAAAQARAATDAEARAWYIGERSQRLARAHARVTRPLFSRFVDAVLVVLGCAAVVIGLVGGGLMLRETEALPYGIGILGIPLGVAAGGAVLVWLGVRPYRADGV